MNIDVFSKFLALILILSSVTNLYWLYKAEPNLRKMVFFQRLFGNKLGKIVWGIFLIVLPLIFAWFLFVEGISLNK